jgi:S-methylmethionine-dependent homocysteine/selenocysteine methylase
MIIGCNTAKSVAEVETIMTNSSSFSDQASTTSSAANEAPSIPEGTTLFDLVAALQDAADDATHSEDEADLLVFASLVELRHYLRAADEVVQKRVA